MCGSATVGGDVMFRKEVLRGSSWASNQPLETYQLCAQCFPWASSIITMAARGEGNERGLLGMPIPQSVTPVTPLGAGSCGYCRRELKVEAVGMDVVPTRRDFVRRSLSRHAGSIQQQRLCSACYYWTRSVLEDSSAMRGASSRQAEGPSGNWLSTADFDASGAGLLRQDEFVLQQTVIASNRQYTHLHPSGGTVRSGPSEVLFVGSGPRGCATSILQAQSAASQARTVVVTTADSASDGFHALVLGAADLLVSPLSPQQIAGAFDRLKDPSAVLERDPATGLARYRIDRWRFGMPAHQISVSLFRGVTIVEGAIYARRYLRGYDRVGVDADANLLLQVYCPADHLELILHRLQSLAGAKGEFKIVATKGQSRAA